MLEVKRTGALKIAGNPCHKVDAGSLHHKTTSQNKKRAANSYINQQEFEMKDFASNQSSRFSVYVSHLSIYNVSAQAWLLQVLMRKLGIMFHTNSSGA